MHNMSSYPMLCARLATLFWTTAKVFVWHRSVVHTSFDRIYELHRLPSGLSSQHALEVMEVAVLVNTQCVQVSNSNDFTCFWWKRVVTDVSLCVHS